MVHEKRISGQTNDALTAENDVGSRFIKPGSIRSRENFDKIM